MIVQLFALIQWTTVTASNLHGMKLHHKPPPFWKCSTPMHSANSLHRFWSMDKPGSSWCRRSRGKWRLHIWYTIRTSQFWVSNQIGMRVMTNSYQESTPSVEYSTCHKLQHSHCGGPKYEWLAFVTCPSALSLSIIVQIKTPRPQLWSYLLLGDDLL